MSEPYVVVPGDPVCEHRNPDHFVLTVIPPIDEWRCRTCDRIVQQRRDPPEDTFMPEVPEK